ncbi:MAG TPA: IclR family transcriptional regulator [Burkholderiaceae bacterium]|nr:IclR family transcriptional regulator [Burkholderiaceae bacterium]
MSHPMIRYLRIPALLEQLARARHPQTLAQLAQRLDLPKTSLMRILSSLVESGFVVHAPGERGFVLGPRATRLALEVLGTPHFSRSSRAILARLVEATGETCNLTALEGDGMRYLERVETGHLLRLKLDVGTHVPLHCTASGKLMLAMMDDAQRRQVLDRIALDRHTPKTLTDRVLLERELATIRQRRVGVDQEEFVLGMVAVSVPVLNATGGMIAAVACHGPTARISMAFLLESVPVMREAALAMGKVLGDDAMVW